MAAQNAREGETGVAKDIRKGGELTVKIDVDISDALTGLKALQREAREATKALRELEEAQKGIGEPITVVDSTGDLIASITGDDVIVKRGFRVSGYGGIIDE